MGCLGFLVRAHLLSADNALLCGMALGLYGLTLAPRLPLAGGLALGCGIGVAFLGRGLLGPLFLLVTALLLPIFATWRALAYLRALGVALLTLAPWVLVWPLLLYQHSPALFEEWLLVHSVGDLVEFLHYGPESDPFFYLKTLPWFAWPALPIALWTLWAGARGLNGGIAKAGIQLPALLFVVMLVPLSLAADTREVFAQPLLLPLCLLGAAGVDSLRRGSSAALDWFGILTFGLLALALWLAWLALLGGQPVGLATQLQKVHPAYQARFETWAVALSAGFTLLWFALVRPARRSNRRAVLNWAAGITLVWGVAMTLWLPYIDYDKSYRGMMLDLKRVLAQEQGCVASRNVAEAQRALLDFFVDVQTQRVERGPENQCPLLLVQGDASTAPPEGPWQEIWRGTRPDDDREVHRLYRHRESAP
jgi:4-amino-4-deoxy-L-arabinose transferase-like glycosyltransferase